MPFVPSTPRRGREAATYRLSLVARRGLDQLRRALGTKHLAGLIEALDTTPSVYLGDHLAVVKTKWGAKLVVDTRDRLLAPNLLLDGCWEDHLTQWLRRSLKPGATFVDVGANIGYYTILGAQLVGPSGRVVAVEAHPGNVALLRRNVRLNGHHLTVTVCEQAAWSERATLSFYERDNFGPNSSVKSVGQDLLDDLADSESAVSVQAGPLDDIDGLAQVDIMKVDIEGSEVRAFKGAERILSSSPDLRVLVEWSPGQIEHVGNSARELVDILQGYGMTLHLAEDHFAPIAAKDLLEVPYGNIVASRDRLRP